MTKAYSYLRFSTPAQINGDSQRRQLEGSARLAADNNWQLDTALNLRDLGISAYKGKNATAGALGIFLAAVESGTVKPGEILIVESLDRLSRQEPMEALDLFRRIIMAGIEIATTIDGQRYTREAVNANPGMLFVMLGILIRGHEESRTKSKRGLASWNQKRKNAASELKPMGAKIPAWIILDNGTFRLDPVKTATIRRMVALVTAGHGLTSIVRTFNADKTPVVSRSEKVKQWELSAVRYLLNSRALIGEFQPHQTKADSRNRQAVGEVIVDYFPSVIDADTYYRMQAVIATRRHTTKAGRTGTAVGNLFGLILHDGRDGATMVMAHKTDGKKYVVNRNVKAGTATGIRFGYSALEYHFLQWVSEINITTSPETSHSAVIEGKIAVQRQKADQLESAMKDSDAASFPRMIAMMQTIEATEAALKIELEAERAKEHRPEYSTSDIAALATTMHQMPEGERRDIRTRLRLAIAAVVSRIDLYIHARNHTRLAIAIVTLANGDRRSFYVQTARGETPMSASTGIAYESTAEIGDTAAFAEAVFDANPTTPAQFTIAIGRATVTA